MKIYVGADVNSVTAIIVTVTSANKADIGELPTLLRERRSTLWRCELHQRHIFRIALEGH
ncbi:MAG: hypothetical protein QS748_01930 [Candidatus Endonucleobacter bathymodioli]|uniref:Uncharacterized protein n=1 Tax=Candidatus Endonucleibacter bathymodioli TaxID=539814 RepID=A0AA90SS53_9GAMM|nr:hypothetical protein [Candidatus Endonucleobacter bathymodioli]